jgi:4-hydroxy-4-methyl-2-oxoglutarate aldolase
MPSPLDGFDAATVHEAYDRRGALPARIKPVDPTSHICAPAFPVDCPADDNLWIHRALYRAAPGDVLVVKTRGAVDAGYWGEILSEAAIARGLAGLVIDGGVRDTERLAAVGLPVFAASICIRGTVKDPEGDGRLGEPVSIGEIVIRSGDTVVGDRDGVVIVPADAVDAVATAARARVTKERDVIARLRRGETTLAVLDLPGGETW